MEKITISLTNDHADMIKKAVASGDYASSSEVVRDALREWKAKHLLRSLWDEGLGSGVTDPSTTIDEIKAKARRIRASKTK